MSLNLTAFPGERPVRPHQIAAAGSWLAFGVIVLGIVLAALGSLSAAVADFQPEPHPHITEVQGIPCLVQNDQLTACAW